MENDKYEKTIYELKQLLEITKVLNSTLNFKKLIDSVLFSFMAQARCVKAALYIGKELDPKVITLQRNYMGFDISPSIPIQLNCKTKAMGIMAKNKKCLTTNDLINIMDESPKELRRLVKEQIELIIPLVIDDNIVGIVLLGGKIDQSNFEKLEMEFLTQIGIYSSIAIQNAILFDMATIDMMTGLKVRHFVTKYIDENIMNGEHNFVIIMLDIDNFKSINDTYGHQTGDDTIKAVSKIMLKAIRNNDIAARFGGEEFVLMLRDTNLDSSVTVAERIRKEIESHEIPTEKGILKTTISVGVAEFDSDLDKTSKDIIGRADSSLYISKKNGKNQITTA